MKFKKKQTKGSSLSAGLGDARSSRGKRSRRRGPKESGTVTAIMWAGRGLVLLAVTGAPWWYGSVSLIAQLILMCICGLGLLVWWTQIVSQSETTKGHRYSVPLLAVPVALGCLLLFLQTLPLSNGVADFLASHQSGLYQQYGTEVDGELVFDEKVLGQFEARPRISMDGGQTSEYLCLLMLALIAMLLARQFFSTRGAVNVFLGFATANAVAISCFGLYQRASHDPQNSVYGLQAVDAFPFGPFVNSNNAAGYLLIGLACCLALLVQAFREELPGQKKGNAFSEPADEHLTDGAAQRLWLNIRIFVSELDTPRLVTFFAAMLISAGVFAATSRGAFLGLATGALVTSAYYSLKSRSAGSLAGLGLAVVCAISLIIYVGYEDRVSREIGTLAEADLLDNDPRLQNWAENLRSISDFAPLGSGLGTYSNVHRLNRTELETHVFVFAENQYIQTVVETGFIGLSLLLAALLILFLSWKKIASASRKVVPPGIPVFGLFLMTSQIVAATFDFGLFIPANALLMATVCGVLVGQVAIIANRTDQKTKLCISMRRFWMLGLLALLFYLAWLGVGHTYKRAQVEIALGGELHDADFRTLPLAETEIRIETLRNRLNAIQDVAGLNRLAELLVHRHRLQLLQQIANQVAESGEASERLFESLWPTTHVMYLRQLNMTGRANSFRPVTNAFYSEQLQRNIFPAVFLLKQSRRRSPLQAHVHLLLGQLHVVSQRQDADRLHLERATELAPTNANIKFIRGMGDLQSGRMDSARDQFKACLQLDPRLMPSVVVGAGATKSLTSVYREFLPDDADVLTNFSNKFLSGPNDLELRKQVLQQVILLLKECGDEKAFRQMYQVQRKLGDKTGALRTTRDLIKLLPNNVELKAQLADALIATGELDEAMNVANELLKRDGSNERYVKLYEKILKLREK